LVFGGIELKIGELVQDPNFTLLEAVGALEVSFDSGWWGGRKVANRGEDHGSEDG
jgi:hypothetical protein